MSKVIWEARHDQRKNVRYLSELTEMARNNRNHPTPAEKLIWDSLLKNRQMGYIFLRQKPIGRFILDFYCSELSLAIEIDGDSHIEKVGRDQLRDAYLNSIGIKTIRFTNEEVLNNIENVRSKLFESLNSSIPPQSSSPSRI